MRTHRNHSLHPLAVILFCLFLACFLPTGFFLYRHFADNAAKPVNSDGATAPITSTVTAPAVSTAVSDAASPTAASAGPTPADATPSASTLSPAPAAEEPGLLLTSAEIQDINVRTMQNPASGVRDLTAFTELSADTLRSDILSYSLPEVPYCNGKALTEQGKSTLLSLRALDAISAPVTLQYGIITENADVRSMPSAWTMTKSTKSGSFDYLQESMLLPCEGVVVAHTSSDGLYYFVYSYNYKGWVTADKIGLCSYEQMCEVLTASSFILLTENMTLDAAQAYLRMGTRIPYRTKTDTQYELLWPVSEAGRLRLTSIFAEKCEAFCDGYLPYTEEYAVLLFHRLLGVPYGWGDMHADMDCSSTVNTVFRCFGFSLPRNTSAMQAIGGTVTELTGMCDSEKTALIRSARRGSILLMPGHVTAYMGEEDGLSQIIHNVNVYYQNGTANPVNACVKTPVTIQNSRGKSYLSLFSYLITLP